MHLISISLYTYIQNGGYDWQAVMKTSFVNNSYFSTEFDQVCTKLVCKCLSFHLCVFRYCFMEVLFRVIFMVDALFKTTFMPLVIDS